MARRRRTSPIEDLVEIASRLPWWVSLLIALCCWLILHFIANSQPNAPQDLHQFGQSAAGHVVRTFAFFGQYLLPVVFVIGGIGSVLARAERKRLAVSVENARESGKTVEGISWREFELLVGEAFRRKGFTVIEKGGNGPDGGIDLILYIGADKYLVQCKQWKAFKVGVTVIREFFGVMIAEGAAGGFIVTSGRYTGEATEFAKGRNIQLVDGTLLTRWIAQRSGAAQRTAAAPEEPIPPVSPPAPLCPVCRSLMVLRTAKRGVNLGSQFWGCVKYPACRGIRQLESE